MKIHLFRFRTASAIVVVGCIGIATIDSGLAYNLPKPPAAANPPPPQPTSVVSRRGLVAGLLTAAAAVQVGPGCAAAGDGSRRGYYNGMNANAADVPPVLTPPPQQDQQQQDVYFGVGCFWHIQHEFVVAERELLRRSDAELTSLTGYAGGNAVGSDGRVCYHNLRSVADYGKLGHGEVVSMRLPKDRIVEFSAVYFSLFNPNTLGACVCVREREKQRARDWHRNR
jgi:hypothetical protein